MERDKKKRPGWDDTFINMALIMARRSTCPRLRTAVLITTADHRLLTSGYNGAPAGLQHCDDVGCLEVGGHCIRTIHAEQNAVAQAARSGVSIEGGTAYSLYTSCIPCTQLLISAGIHRVVIEYQYKGHSIEDVERMQNLYLVAGVKTVMEWFTIAYRKGGRRNEADVHAQEGVDPRAE